MEIVIAHYNNCEFQKLIEKFSDKSKIVYDKSNNYNKVQEDVTVIKRINEGREGETYLYHIITNYNNLSEYTLFIQDDTEEHITDYDQFKVDTDKMINNNIKFHLYNLTWRKGMHPIERTIQNGLCNLHTLGSLDAIKIACEKNNILLPDIYTTETCAFFLCHKDIILKKPIEFYINLRDWLLEDEKNGFILEHLWKIIFI